MTQGRPARTADNTAHAPIPPDVARQPLHRAFLAVRARLRLIVIVRAALVICAGFVLTAMALGFIDFALRLPMGFRVVLWLGGVAAVVWAMARIFAPAIRFRPDLGDVAVRVEASLPNRRNRGILAAGLAFEREHASGLPGAMGARVREQATAILPRSRILRTVQAEPLGAPAGIAGAVLAIVALMAIMAPDTLGTGARRVLTPWDGAAWPKLAQIADRTSEGVRAMGSTAELRAELTRSPRSAGQSRVWASVRWLGDGESAAQPAQTTRARMIAQPGSGDAYTLEVTPPAELATSATVTLEYSFEAHDDRSERRSIRFEHRPRIELARIDIIPPEYARDAIGALRSHATGESRWRGEESRGRLRVGPVLAGSEVRINLDANKPASARVQGSRGWDALLEGAAVDSEGDGSIVVTGVASSAGAIALTLEDASGLTSAGSIEITLDVTGDLAPTPTVAEPARDEEALAGATLPIAAEARDDIQLTGLWLEATTMRPPSGSLGAPIEPAGPATEIARATLGRGAVATLRADATLSLDTLALAPGDELWIVALATDAMPGRDAPATSRVRKIRVIGAERFLEQIWGELGDIRSSAIRADELQSQLQQRMARGEQTEPIARSLAEEQGRLRDQIASQRDRLDRLAERIERNALDDDALQMVLDSARDTAGEARTAAERAAGRMLESAQEAERIERGEQPTPDAEQRAQEAREAAEEDQNTVRDELGELIGLLSREGDGYLVRRDLERLAQQQQRLMEQTEQFAEQTAGRSREQLSPEEQRELDRIASRQEELADSARETLDALSRRAREMQEADPAQSAAMRRAAERGRQAELEEQLREAAEQLGQNQTGEAGQRQQDALDALEEMLEDLRNADRNRNEQLRRVLASVVDSLETIIRQQEAALSALEATRGDDLSGLAPEMIAIQRNTLGVGELVAGEGDDLAPVTALIDEALDAQADAIIALRSEPSRRTIATEAERESLDKLIAAKDLAQELLDRADEEELARQRAELRRAYREALEEQIAIRSDVGAMEGMEIGRRERRDLLQLATRQNTLVERMRSLIDETEELPDAVIFRLAHDRYDSTGRRAIDRLRESPVDRATMRSQDTLVSLLRSIVDALRDEQQEQDFRQEEGESGGGQGGSQDQPLVPPMAQLKLIRAMQEEAFMLTRELDTLGQEADALEIQQLIELQRDLAEYGQELLDSLSEGGAGGGGAPGRPSP